MSGHLPIHSVRHQVVHPRYGTFRCSGATLDVMIARHLPASPLKLREVLREQCPDVDWSDINNVSDALVILGDLCAYEFGDTGA